MNNFKRAHRMDLPPSIIFSMDHGTIDELDLETPQPEQTQETNHEKWLGDVAVKGQEQGWGQ